jgi:hypothetical protein
MITDKFRLGIEQALATTPARDYKLFHLRVWDLAFEAIADQLVEAIDKYNASHPDTPVDGKALIDVFIWIRNQT